MRNSLGIAVLLACAGCGADPSRPPSIRYGEEACARCRMIISDDRFAAALVTSGGETLKFDDIGCLVDHEAGRQSPPGTTYWVRDSAGGDWLDARAATYVRSVTVPSPMGYGLKALPPTSPEAGPALRFADLPAVVSASRGEEQGTARPDL